MNGDQMTTLRKSGTSIKSCVHSPLFTGISTNNHSTNGNTLATIYGEHIPLELGEGEMVLVSVPSSVPFSDILKQGIPDPLKTKNKWTIETGWSNSTQIVTRSPVGTGKDFYIFYYFENMKTRINPI